MPVILTLLTAIVAVRAFGMARPVFRYAERLVSHDAALRLLAERRTTAYARLIPLTPARLGRRRRSDVLTGVVDDLTDAVDAQVRVTVPVIGSLVAGAIAIGVTTVIAPPVGLVLTGLALVVAAICALAARLEARSLGDLLAARAEVTRVSELMATQAHELRAVGGWPTALGWLDDAHATLARVTRRVSLGRAAAAALFLLAVGAAVVVVAVIAQGLDVAAPVKALLALTPVAVSDAISPLVDAMRALARATESERRIDALLDLDPAVHDPAPAAAHRPTHPTTQPPAHIRGRPPPPPPAPACTCAPSASPPRGRATGPTSPRPTSTCPPDRPSPSPGPTAAASRRCSPCSPGTSTRSPAPTSTTTSTC